MLVNFEDHLELVVLPQIDNPKDTIIDGLNRMIKLLQTFEKLGYATDPYLGNLTVSPKNLGTSLVLEAVIGWQNRNDSHIDRETADEIEFGKHIKITNRLNDHQKRDIVLRTQQSLAPNYNEVI